MNVIQKLKDHKIFKENSLIESTIEKSWMGSPITVKGTLIVKKLNIDDCVCEEYQSASDKIYKIRYFNIMTIDGMKPQELAAVYNLAPKTERFKKHKNQ